jgi:membrane-bound serine protease (ClpP class)
MKRGYFHRLSLPLLLLALGTWSIGLAAVEDGGKAGVERAAQAPSLDTGGARRVLLLVVDGGINPATADYIHDGIEVARQSASQAVLIQLDTPGGLLDSSKTIVKDILGAPVPVIVYVAPSGAGATSAGVFVTMAAHVAAMAPGTNIGAAHPVGGQGQDIDDDMREKVENFAASLSRTIARQRGRNVEWAEKAVRESVSITEQEAVDLKVVDLIAENVTQLLEEVDGRQIEIEGRTAVLQTAGASIERHEMRLRQKILDVLANPNVAYLLMMAGILGLYMEFTHPGLFFPGITGAICLLLAMAALQVLPINYSGLALIVFGVALLVTELFLPSFGIIGVGGVVAFVLGSLLLFDTPESTLAVDPGIVAAAATMVGGFMLIVSWLVVRAHRRRPALGMEGLLGEIGEVRRAASPNGKVKVFVHGEYWDAETDEPLQLGESVEVVSARGMRLRVRRHNPARPA